MARKVPIIELQNVFKTYLKGEVRVPALKGINLKIVRGEFISIMGPSGSGKSTLMNIIGCLDKPTKGKVFLSGIDTSKLDENEIAQIRGKKIGFVFQQFNLINSLDAMKNIMLPMVFQSVPLNKRKQKARDLLERVGLKRRGKHKPSELSGGEIQRIAIARALVNDPEIILADEPTGNIDSKTGREVMKTISELNRKYKRTIVMVTHEQYIANYSKKIVRIRDGKIKRIFYKND